MARRDAQGQFADTLEGRKNLTSQVSGNQQRSRAPFGSTQPTVAETSIVGGNLIYGQNATWVNPMNFPGWGSLYTGSYPTYRWVLQHPVVRLARAIANSVITSSTWEYEAQAGAKDDWVKGFSATMNRLRPQLMADFFARGKDFGWSAGEVMWSYDADANEYVLQRIKPLLPDVTEVLEDAFGNATGLRNYVSPDGMYSKSYVDIPMPFKAWFYRYDSEADYKYGRSWIENIRSTAWTGWLRCAQELRKLSAKITGMVSIVISPAGTFPGPIDPSTGLPKEISFQKNAIDAIKGLANGAPGAWFPSIGLRPDPRGGLDAMKVMHTLIGKSLTNWQVLDFGSNTPAIQGILEEMQHYEELIINGALRSARMGLEAKHGTKEEAGVHTDIGTLIAEEDDREFARQVQPLGNAWLSINASPKAVDKVLIKPPSLVDRKTQVVRAVLLALLNNQIVCQAIAKGAVDMQALFQNLGIAVRKDYNFDEVIKDIQSQKPQGPPSPQPNNPNQPRRNQHDPQGGRPSEQRRIIGPRAVAA